MCRIMHNIETLMEYLVFRTLRPVLWAEIRTAISKHSTMHVCRAEMAVPGPEDWLWGQLYCQGRSSYASHSFLNRDSVLGVLICFFGLLYSFICLLKFISNLQISTCYSSVSAQRYTVRKSDSQRVHMHSQQRLSRSGSPPLSHSSSQTPSTLHRGLWGESSR